MVAVENKKVDIEDIKKLRELTLSSISDCKKALEESNGDIEEAVKIIKKKGAMVADKRSDNSTSQGVVIAGSSSNFGCIVKLSCETDFVARNEKYIEKAREILKLALDKRIKSLEELNNIVSEDISALVGMYREKIVLSYDYLEESSNGEVFFYTHFALNIGILVGIRFNDDSIDSEKRKEVGNNIVIHIAINFPISVSRESIDEEKLKEIKEEAIAQSTNAKDENIREKMITGKMNKFFKEYVLLEQILSSDDNEGITVEQYLKKVSATISSFKIVKI